MALVRINGQQKFFDTEKFVMRKVSAGKWNVEYDRGAFTVIGGRESGGAAHEWFCYRPEVYGEQYLPARSRAAAIKLGVVY